MPTFEHELQPIDPTIDLSVLPEKARRELVEFYEFLVFKYQHNQPNQNTFAQSPQTSSKWAKIAQRVQNDPVHLAGYAEELKKDFEGNE